MSTINIKALDNKMVNILDELIDKVNKKVDPIKGPLIDALGTLIKDYEDRNFEEPKGDLIGVLKFLLDKHGLGQSELQEIGSQGVVSEILNGKRKFNLRQVVVLSKRF